ncbi:MAG TPA: AMP-binding protein [Nitrospiria bacterium]|nr:AMP-binding protein [Nitrospiria bacterium]
MKSQTDGIYDEVLDFIRHPVEGRFDTLALRVFSFQFDRNPSYRRYCEAKDQTPDTVRSWREIPAVPTAAFKELDLVCDRPQKVFLTSGTSQGPSKRGRHSVPRLDIYRASVLPNFTAHLLPDLAELRMLLLAGSPALWPHSSLTHMMEVVRQEYGGPDSAYYITEAGLDLDGLSRSLREVCEQNKPVMLAGVTLAFHQFLEHCQVHRMAFRLPPGSRIMDTGGFKGQKINLSPAELYRRYEIVLGIPQTHIVNEYGMTEMGSQFYDNVLADYLNGLSRPRHKRVPPWVQTRVVDPETLEERPAGSTGMLRHYDLANCGSVMALQTEDIGHTVGDGFEVTGRASGSEARGCSLLIEEILRTQ